MKKGLAFLYLSVLLIKVASSQDQDTTLNWNILNMSLNELMNIEIVSTSKKQLPIKESPGIVSVITEAEIRNSEARDLMDVLRLVPGLDFGSEWDNVIGFGVRGNNATEGKFLMLIDGLQLNETNFGIFPFGNHILIDNISKVEVIRGPGSVVYGGSAELAVINILTKKGKDLSGLEASTSYGYSDGNTLGYNIQTAYGKKWKNGLEVSIAAYYGKSNRSNKLLHTLDTTAINYKDSSRIITSNVNLNLNYKSIDLRFLYDNYLSQNTEVGGSVLFESYISNLSYVFKINDKLSFKPSFNWKIQKPWYFVNYNDKRFYNTINNRLRSSIEVTYLPTDNISTYFGYENYTDKSRKTLDTVVFASTKKNSLSYISNAVYFEFLYNSKFINIDAGARYDYHSEYGNAFVPRLALTKVFNKFNCKALFSKAYKAPTISNIDYNKDIKPERTTVYELEGGYRLSNDMNIVVNFFIISIKNPILYIPNPVTGADYYKNFEKTGTKGFELVYRIKKNWGYTNFSYSYYQKNKNTVNEYNIQGKNYTYGAYPQNRINILASFNVTSKLKLNSTIDAFGRRYTYIHSSKDWSQAELVSLKNKVVINLNLSYENFLVEGLNASFGVYDLTNQQYEFINAYHGMQNQIPAVGREFMLKLSANIK